MDNKNSFIMYTDYMTQINLLNMEQRGVLLTAIMNYHLGEALPDMDRIVEMAFSFIEAQFKRDSSKYEKVIEQRKEAGKRGGRPKKNQEIKESEEKAKKANGFLEKQKKQMVFQESEKSKRFLEKAKKADNDNDNVNDNDIISSSCAAATFQNNLCENFEENTKNNIDILSENKKTDAKENGSSVTYSVTYTQVIEIYHSICKSYPKLHSKVSESRKKAIKARLNSYTLENFKTVFEKAQASDFLKGKNKNNWSATFDWMMKDANFVKILEGNYDNKEIVQPLSTAKTDPENKQSYVAQNNSKPNRFHNFEQRNYDFDALERGFDEQLYKNTNIPGVVSTVCDNAEDTENKRTIQQRDEDAIRKKKEMLDQIEKMRQECQISNT